MDNELRALVDLRDRVLQKNRIAFGNRINAVNLEADETTDQVSDLYHRWYERFLDLEKEADNDIKELAKDYPIIEEISQVKGIGVLLASKMVSLIDITRADTVSALWRYAGYAVIDGERERPRKGEKLSYNVRLKTTMYLIATGFLRSNSPYRRIYDSAKEYYEINRPDWTKGHRHNAAIRKMIKIFLSHVWLRWRSLEGLQISEPYVNDKLAHIHYYAPEEFGWLPLS